MRIYCTSKNGGPDWGAKATVTMLYLGTNEQEALNVVKNDNFDQYKRDTFPLNYPESFSAIPATMAREMLHWYFQDNQWYSIVSFDLY